MEAETSPTVDSSSEDTSGLKSALQKERSRADALARQLTDLQSAQELQNQTLAEQVQTLTASNLQLQASADQEKAALLSQLESRDKRAAFLTSYSQSSGLPEYSDLVYAWAESQLVVSEGKVKTRDGKMLSELLDQARVEKPALFASPAAPSGTGSVGSTGGGRYAQTRLVQAADTASLSAIDPKDILNGKVKIDL